ncbi:MAG TPA: hypothetical protein VJG90_01585 [Candidatus Nanoarchaeia archaeon]|nr:hypothetical protein [Candidatus Nanoarchaeia archaeon]
MDMYKLKWTRLQAEIIRLFCIRAGQTLNLRGVAKALNVTPTAISKALPELQKKGIIKIKPSKTMNLLSLELNRENPKTTQLKRTENLRLIYESELSNFLYHEFPGCTIILFGSYSLGEDIFTETEETRSDIDIAIIGTKGKKINLTRFDTLLERKININFYESWKTIHKNLKDNILNGIILSGGIDL